MSVALLRGRDHLEHGAVACIGDGGAAIALSIGGAPKRYAHTDPNEDGALLATGVGGVLVAVADGHSGAEAAEAALERLRDGPAAEWTGLAPLDAGRWPETAREALCAANDAILALPRRGMRRRSRTTLSFAVVRPREGTLHYAAIGDSHVFVVGARDAHDLALDLPAGELVYFLGQERETAGSLREKTVAGTRPLEGLRALVLATDGLSERGVGVRQPEVAVHEAVSQAAAGTPGTQASVAARALLERALAAHRVNPSGDNVAAAVVWTESSGAPTLRSLLG